VTWLRSARSAALLAWAAAPLGCTGSVLLMLVAGLTPAVSALLQRSVLDAMVSGSDHMLGRVMGIAVALSGIALITAVAPYVRRYIDSEMRRRLGLLVQDNVYRSINAFPGMSRFESPRFSDKLQLVQQVPSTASSFLNSVLGIGQGLITAITLGMALYLISPAMTALVALSAVPAVWTQLRNSRKQVHLAWRNSPITRRQNFYSRLLTDQAAAKEIRLLGLGDFLHGRMLAEMRSIQRGQRALDLRLFRTESLLSLLSAAVSAAGLLWIIWRVAHHQAPIGDVTLLAAAVIGVQMAISGGITSLAQLTQSMLLFSHYDDLISMAPDLPISTDPRPVLPLRQGIAFQDVWFRYDESHPWVLRGLNLVIPSGATVAVVGLNGAGKSTLVKLLCRFYDPVKGAITWDGLDISEAEPAELRQHIGTVFQDYMSYDLTAAENVGMGDLARMDDRDRIRAAAELAAADAAVSRLPRGYDTLLSRIFFGPADQENQEAGVILSGGQWQRLALARGFMRHDRDLLILDEPSSGLDAEAESAIHHQLQAIRTGRTSVLISHRLSTVRDADIIYVVADGQVAEKGTHDELMAADGKYHRLFSLQASGYQDEMVSNNHRPLLFPSTAAHLRAHTDPGIAEGSRSGRRAASRPGSPACDSGRRGPTTRTSSAFQEVITMNSISALLANRVASLVPKTTAAACHPSSPYTSGYEQCNSHLFCCLYLRSCHYECNGATECGAYTFRGCRQFT
jgi:ATP-binding cassette subfamily B protein